MKGHSMTTTEIEKLAGILPARSLGAGLERTLQYPLQGVNKPSSLSEAGFMFDMPVPVTDENAPPVRTFDTLVKCSKNIPEIVGHLNRAKLFQFFYKDISNNIEQLVKDTWSKEQVDNFHLPFPCIAVQAEMSCSILYETDTAGVFGFIICMDFATDSKEKPFVIVQGIVTFNFPEKFTGDMLIPMDIRPQIASSFSQNYQFKGRYVMSEKEQADSICTIPQRLSKAVSFIVLLNLPNKFILENAPIRATRLIDRSKKNKKKTILTAAERPVYVLLSPKEIREKTGMVSTGGKVKAHERRRHIRTFRSDRFTKVQGKSIVIPSTWVGESEKVVGNRRYKVLLDV